MIRLIIFIGQSIIYFNHSYAIINTIKTNSHIQFLPFEGIMKSNNKLKNIFNF